MAVVLPGLGCQSNPDTIMGPRTAAADPVPLEGYPNVLLRDALDHDLVLVGEPIVTGGHGGDDQMAVSVRLRCVAPFDVPVQYCFKFYGPNRKPLTDYPVWYDVILPSTHDRTFAGSSITEKATEWELEVRRPRYR